MGFKKIVTDGITDILDPDERCICHLIRLADLEGAAGSYYLPPVQEHLFDGFRELADSPDKKIRGADFPVFIGDYFGGHEPYFIVGLSNRISEPVHAIMRRHLALIPGYNSISYGSASEVRIIPFWRYQKGKVVAYTTEDTGVTTDQRTGLKVVGRNRVMIQE